MKDAEARKATQDKADKVSVVYGGDRGGGGGGAFRPMDRYACTHMTHKNINIHTYTVQS